MSSVATQASTLVEASLFCVILQCSS
ncbi:hypothetical protein NPIL_261741, partial [Nephila pilipes]